MAKKGGSKETCANESNQNMFSEQKTNDSIKQKISKIQEMFPTATREQITKVLAFCDNDESNAIHALNTDGGIEAMSHSIELDQKSKNNNKNKKKKKKNRKEIFPSASFDADDSSSLHSSSNIDLDVEKDCSRSENGGGTPTEIIKEMKHDDVRLSDRDNLKSAQTEKFSKDQSKFQTKGDTKSVREAHFQRRTSEEHSPNQENINKSSRPRNESSACGSPESDYSEKQDKPNQRKDSFRGRKEDSISRYNYAHNEDSHPKSNYKQRTGSFHRSKTSSFSEESTSQSTSQAVVPPIIRGYEKCKKDLSRQSTSLQRIHHILEKSLDDSSKRLKNSFNDVRKMLDRRQELMEQEMERTKQEALSLLKSRQDLAIELKRRVERSPAHLSDSEWTVLRSDIKQYVTERKYDEELATPAWFQWSMDAITESLNNFGEVRPVKNVYSQRSHTLLGNAAHADPSPSSSVANEEINSISDKNDNDISEATENLPSSEKEAHSSYKSSRVFSNSNNKTYYDGGRRGRGGGRRFNSGRGGGPPRGAYSGYKSNYGNNNYGNYDHPANYRNHPANRSRPYRHSDSQSDYPPRSAPPYPNERNVNANVPTDIRNNERSHGNQGQPMPFRPRNNRNQPNMVPRSSAENSSKPEVPAPEHLKDNANIDKPNAVNGY